MENKNGCIVCGKNMLESDSCGVAVMYYSGEQYMRIPVRGFRNERCGDCNALVGKYHHWGCDLEICPVCGGQLISCDCLEVDCPVIVNKRSGRKSKVFSRLQK